MHGRKDQKNFGQNGRGEEPNKEGHTRFERKRHWEKNCAAGAAKAEGGGGLSIRNL